MEAPPRTVYEGSDVLGAGCPVRRVLRLVGDKWSPVVLHCLSEGVCRFGDLQRRIPDISKKMLTQVLRDLEKAALVKRMAYPSTPPRTEYELTESGRRMHEPLAALCHWANENLDLLASIETNSGNKSPGTI